MQCRVLQFTLGACLACTERVHPEIIDAEGVARRGAAGAAAFDENDVALATHGPKDVLIGLSDNSPNEGDRSIAFLAMLDCTFLRTRNQGGGGYPRGRRPEVARSGSAMPARTDDSQ